MEVSTTLTVRLGVGLGRQPFASHIIYICDTCAGNTIFLPEAVPTVAAQMVTRIANERMVTESGVDVCSGK